MKRLMSIQFATNGLLFLLSLFVVFHVLVLIGVIPFHIIGGGRIDTHAQMAELEMVSIPVCLFMTGIVAIKANLLKVKINPIVITVLLWAMFGFFMLNTLGNLVSKSEFEKSVFTPVTILISILLLRILIIKK